MDFLAELLPPSYLIKPETTSKDKRQNPTYRNTANPNNKTVEEYGGEATAVAKKVAISEWKEGDRRSGKDRRKQMAKRGRWLESRERNDRRASKFDLCVKV